MSMIAAMDAFRTKEPGVETVTYADLRSGTVFCTSARLQQRQEQLDDLCASAAALLEKSGQGGDQAMALSATSARLFLKSSPDAAEALCIVADPRVALDGILSRARGLLDNVGRGD